MRFHFRNDSHAGGVLVHHPSYLVLLDAHSSTPSLACRGVNYNYNYSKDTSNANNNSRMPAFLDAHWKLKKHNMGAHHEDDHGSISDNPASSDDEENVASKTKRALHLEHHERECIQAIPDPHSRPRSRQFFRLGRHRSRASASSTNLAAAASQKDGSLLSKPMMRRTMSLPTELINASGSVNGKHSTDSELTQESNPSSEKNDKSAPSKPSHRRHVTFTSVHVREYSRILGDHPCCPSGPPLSLGWNMERQDSFQLDAYEKERDSSRRSKCDMRLGCEDRREILASLVKPVMSMPQPNGMDNENGVESSSLEDASLEDSSAQVTVTQTCCVYSRQEIRKTERRIGRERAENHRTHRRMNKGFFQPLTPAESSLSPTSMGVPATAATTANSTSGEPTSGQDGVTA